jgi:hypothetical protein
MYVDLLTETVLIYILGRNHNACRFGRKWKDRFRVLTRKMRNLEEEGREEVEEGFISSSEQTHESRYFSNKPQRLLTPHRTGLLPLKYNKMRRACADYFLANFKFHTELGQSTVPLMNHVCRAFCIHALSHHFGGSLQCHTIQSLRGLPAFQRNV